MPKQYIEPLQLLYLLRILIARDDEKVVLGYPYTPDIPHSMTAEYIRYMSPHIRAMDGIESIVKLEVSDKSKSEIIATQQTKHQIQVIFEGYVEDFLCERLSDGKSRILPHKQINNYKEDISNLMNDRGANNLEYKIIRKYEYNPIECLISLHIKQIILIKSVELKSADITNYFDATAVLDVQKDLSKPIRSISLKKNPTGNKKTPYMAEFQGKQIQLSGRMYKFVEILHKNKHENLQANDFALRLGQNVANEQITTTRRDINDKFIELGIDELIRGSGHQQNGYSLNPNYELDFDKKEKNQS